MGCSRQKPPVREHKRTSGPPRQDLDSFRMGRDLSTIRSAVNKHISGMTIRPVNRIGKHCGIFAEIRKWVAARVPADITDTV